MLWLVGIFSLLVAATGWYYAFYSDAATALVALEAQALNVRRVRLRRAGGVLMILLAICFYLGSVSADPQTQPLRYVFLWIGVMTLMTSIVVLALIDIRLTWKLKQALKNHET